MGVGVASTDGGRGGVVSCITGCEVGVATEASTPASGPVSWRCLHCQRRKSQVYRILGRKSYQLLISLHLVVSEYHSK